MVESIGVPELAKAVLVALFGDFDVARETLDGVYEDTPEDQRFQRLASAVTTKLPVWDTRPGIRLLVRMVSLAVMAELGISPPALEELYPSAPAPLRIERLVDEAIRTLRKSRA